MRRTILLLSLVIFLFSCGVVDNTESSGTYSLNQNYPNPFDGVTHISYYIGTPGHAHLIVRNTNQQEIARLVDGDITEGEHSVIFDAQSLSSGAYPYTLTVNDFSATKQMILIR